MVQRHELITYLEGLLEPGRFQDYAPNGLQVEGRAQVRSLATGVTASQDLIEAALARGADTLLVHHGYFWRGEAPCITGMKRQRLARLLQAEMNLLAYHLPLDAHPHYGNNVQLAQVLGLSLQGTAGPTPALLCYGELPTPMSGESWAAHLAQRLNRTPLYIPGRSVQIRRVAWCTGAAQNYIIDAVGLGVDAYLTGEVSESTVHIARECGLHFFAAGHHATERYGVQALGAHLAQHFGIDHFFIDIDNPV